MITFPLDLIIDATPIRNMHMFRPAAIEVHAKPQVAVVFIIIDKSKTVFLPYLRTASETAQITEGNAKFVTKSKIEVVGK